MLVPRLPLSGYLLLLSTALVLTAASVPVLAIPGV